MSVINKISVIHYVSDFGSTWYRLAVKSVDFGDTNDRWEKGVFVGLHTHPLVVSYEVWALTLEGIVYVSNVI